MLSEQWGHIWHPVEACLQTAQCVRICVRAGWEAPAVAKEAAAGSVESAPRVVLRCSVRQRVRRGVLMVIGEQRTDQTAAEAREDGARSAESEHVEVCPRCGQSFDSRILHQVIYHDQPEHKPIETTI
jgi:hypothetical protein